jgi:hypothetical protein
MLHTVKDSAERCHSGLAEKTFRTQAFLNLTKKAEIDGIGKAQQLGQIFAAQL